MIDRLRSGTGLFDDRWAAAALGILRIVAALLFIEHGTAKLLGFPAAPMGMPPSGSLLWIAGLIELIGGLFVLAGFMTSPAAILLSGEMAVGYFMMHAPKSAFPLLNMGESAILFCFVFLLIAVAGPGLWSVDSHLFARRRPATIASEAGAPSATGPEADGL